MWQLPTKQKTFTVGEVSIGGTLGENPTVLMGSIFYYKQRSIKFEEETGNFNRIEAERLIKNQEEFSDKTGLPCMLDVVLPSKKWIDLVLDFVTSITDAPILLDAASAEIRVAALGYAKQVGILDKCVYNSLNPESKQAEFDRIKETGLKAGVLLAYNSKDITTNGRIKAVKQLIPLLGMSGVEKILVDTCVLDVPTLGSAFRTIFELKNELGYPTGCGAHNAIETWRGLKSKMGSQAEKSCMAAASTIILAAGADFVLYGQIEDAPYVFPAVAMVNAAFAQLVIEKGKTPPLSHPIFKIA